MARKWPDEHKRFVEKHYSLLGKSLTTQKLNKRFQTNYSERGVARVADSLDAKDTPADHYTLKELSGMFGAHRNTLVRFINNDQIQARFANKRWLVHESALPFLDDYFKPIDPGYILLKEAAKQIGVYETSVREAIKRNGLNAKKFGRYWYLRQADIDQLVIALKKTGLVKTPWQKHMRKSA